jgi:hypothetical protein
VHHVAICLWLLVLGDGAPQTNANLAPCGLMRLALQVPQQLTACFATNSNTAAGLENKKWGPSMSYKTSLHWTLTRDDTPM